MIELKRGTSLIIREAQAILQTQTSFDRAKIPPTPPTAVGTSEMQPEPEATEADLFWALHHQAVKEASDPNAEPLLLKDLDKYATEYGLNATEPQKQSTFREKIADFYHTLRQDRPVDRFIAKAQAAGLIKPLSIREYIGVLS